MSSSQIVTTTDSFIEKATMTPREIVAELDRHIVGQDDAKRAVAIALRNRWRRSQVSRGDVELGKEITPKNILMMGPTGVGKTEIARRLAQLAGAPFIKVEATKFTEVGYVGRDVEQIIRDLIEVAIKLMRERSIQRVDSIAAEAAEERVLDILVPPDEGELEESTESTDKESPARQLFRNKLRRGELDDKEIDVDLLANQAGFEIMGPPGMEDMVGQLQSMMENMSSRKTKTRRLTVKEALKQLKEDEAAKMVNEEDIKTQAIEAVENNGIVFLDEIDKVVRRTDGQSTGGDVSREGVQRDLLPLIEGSTVVTKHGMIKTDHILFIASGAFHLAKPSDLIPELQGRLPIRVELKPLSVDDFIRILTEPYASLTRQYKALLDTEGVTLEFSQDGIQRMAAIAFDVNETSENIGARRLYTVMEKLLQNIAFSASDQPGTTVQVDEAYVNEQLDGLAQDQNLSQYIL